VSIHGDADPRVLTDREFLGKNRRDAGHFLPGEGGEQ